MKSSEFHRKITSSKKKKWYYVNAEGSHYIYEDENGIRYSVPYHGAKEIAEPLRRKIARDMGI
jgi:predicted RNA binding protein YcfA (HicA-like mRNA interferase family)